ncbi:MAG TPA: ABC transporter permease [bacterium]|nr:ABC transporter permease [bacterium]
MNDPAARPRAARATPPSERRVSPGWDRFRRNRLAVGGAVFLAVLALACTAAPLLTRYSPVAMTLDQPYRPPGVAHPLGTDTLGRDVWSRIVFGGRFDLGLSVLAVLLATSGGVCIGLVSGYAGGALDDALMRIVDVLLAIPDLLLALALVAFIGPSLTSVVLILAFSRMPRYARLVRGSVLGLKKLEFVTAATVLGASRARILVRHLVPNLTGPISVYSTLDLGGVIAALAGLSFVGVGIQPPAAEWGLMLTDARQNLVLAPWTAVFPGLAITLCIIAFNFVGDGARDALDPRTRRRTR